LVTRDPTLAPSAAGLDAAPSGDSALVTRFFSGQPLVLGFTRAWCAPAPEDLARLRRELRGLGAALLVFAPESVVSLAADDELELRAGDAGFERTAFERLVPRAARHELGRAALTLVILDADGNPAWHGHARRCDDPIGTLLQGLSGASRELCERRGSKRGITRREWLGSLAAALALSLGEGCRPDRPATDSPPAALEARGTNTALVRLKINGQPHELELEPRVSLLDVLRERIGLTGTKKGCDHGQCGACTVLIDGRRVNACLTLAVMVRGEVTTVEGLSDGESLHPVQRAFIEEDALQCGYCTPGQIMSAVALIQEGHADDPAEIRESMSGNICRCGAYPNIVRAIVKARKAGA
jgi:xanthine dehydrogenase YagT iron-sulfur-binding subunit